MNGMIMARRDILTGYKRISTLHIQLQYSKLPMIYQSPGSSTFNRPRRFRKKESCVRSKWLVVLWPAASGTLMRYTRERSGVHHLFETATAIAGH
jgi:hypothetical protein